MKYTRDELRPLTILEGLPDADLDWLCEHGEKITLGSGERMFDRGQTADALWIVVKGVIQGFEEIGGQWLLVATTVSGKVTGMLPFSRMTHYPRHTVARDPSEVLRLDASLFKELLDVSPEIGRRLVAHMSDRVRVDVRLEQQGEKMMALGRLSAGLAHELNNPAAAVRRAAVMLSEHRAKQPDSLQVSVDGDVQATHGQSAGLPGEGGRITGDRGMPEQFPLMVPGATPDGERMDVHAPYDMNLIATVERGGPQVVEKALDTAYRLFRDKDAWLSAARRIEILRGAAAIMQERRQELAVEAAREGGKPLIDSLVEVDRAVDGVHECVEFLRTQHGNEIPMRLNAASANRVAFTRHEPIGVVVAFSAFNHPLNLIVHQVAPAVATGCPCIVKPAEATPLSGMRFVGILREAGLPEEWCQGLMTTDLDVAGSLATDGRVAFFSFIGSARVGWMLRSKLAPGTRCALEHGGAAPVLVAEDAELDYALPLISKGGFYHAGQVCVSVQRVYAHRSIARDVAERLAQAATALNVGDPTSPDTEVGPLIRPAEVERVGEWVKEAVDHGAELLAGGSASTETCYAPTVLFDPPGDARVSTLEIFGPVICVYPYDDIDDALARSNSLPHAFQASVFTSDLDTALRASRRLDASAVMVNDHPAFRVDWMPFAGLRESGLGVGGIPHTMEDMQIRKMMVIRSKEL